MSKTGRGSNCTAADNKITALQLRKDGLSYQQIADRLGVSRETSRRYVMSSLADLRELAMDETRELRALLLEEYSRVAFASMGNFATWGPDGVTLIESSELTDEQLAAVAEVSETTTKDGGSKRIKLYDKLKAMDSIAALIGLNAPTKQDVKTEVTIDTHDYRAEIQRRLSAIAPSGDAPGVGGQPATGTSGVSDN